mgnify:CR=1 FL=1
MKTNRSLIFFILLLLKVTIAKEINLEEFLSYKTVDVLRQIYWSSTELLPDEYKSKYKNFFIFNSPILELKNKILEMSGIIVNETKNDINSIEENKVFEIYDNYSIISLITNDKIPKNFLINFALNVDKYSRTEKQEINSALDYLNYLSTQEISDFIHDKLEEFPKLYQIDNFRKYILNDIVFNFADIDGYLKNKSKKELIQIIYGFEKFCTLKEQKDNTNCQIAYKTYDHENLDSYSADDIGISLSTYKRKLDIKDLDIFISKIENRGFEYIDVKTLFKNNKIEESKEYVKAFETYYKRQMKYKNSLSKRDEYIDRLGKNQLIEILEWAVDIFPELNEKKRFKDILSSQTNLQYGKVKEFIITSERYKILKYAYNIHTFQNNIASKYDNDLINFIRFNTDSIYDQIFRDTNNNVKLQEKTNFDTYAELHEHDIKEYLKTLQINQLKRIIRAIISYSYKESKNQDGKTLSEKKDLLESIEQMNYEELLNYSFKYIDNNGIKDIYGIQEKENIHGSYEIRFLYLYLYNIMDFFRSTDINYLRIWLRKYELEIRKLSSERYVSGGLKNNFMNYDEYTKNELLKIYDIYVNEYPELFYPEKFIKISGLDNGITPHKFLVDNRDNRDIILNVVFSIISYFQRKNNQINFAFNEYLGIIAYNLTDDENEKNKEYIRHNFLYSIFRFLNIFPELNNMVFFRRLCLDEKTRIINSNEEDKYFNTGRDLAKIVEYINIYDECTNGDYIRKLKDSEEEHKNIIKRFLERRINEEIKYRVLDGDLYPIIYKCELYFQDESDTVINNIYVSLHLKNYIDSFVQDKTLQINDICDAINKYKELQNVNNFDVEYYYINIQSEGYEEVEDLYNYLNNIDNRQLFYYTIIANLIKIEYEKKDDSVRQISDIYLKINYMSRNSMIRYILNVAKSSSEIKEKINQTNLRKLIKKYYIDIGSDNVYDLTMY